MNMIRPKIEDTTMTDSELRLECYRLAGWQSRSAAAAPAIDHAAQFTAAKELYGWCISEHVLTVSQEDFDALGRDVQAVQETGEGS